MFNPSHLFTASALLIILSFINVASIGEVKCPNNYTIRTTLSKLKRHAFCKYDSFVRPVRKHSDTVDVKLRLIIRKIDFDERSDLLKIHSYFAMGWKDYHLVWNKTDFDNIDEIQVISYYLWRPDIDLLTNGDTYNPMYYYYAVCRVYYTGQVNCVPPITHTASCAANLVRWPYDQHTCKLVMGSWTHFGEEINVSLPETPIMFYDYEMNREWDLLSTRAFKETEMNCCEKNETYPTITFQFILQRHSGVYFSTVVVPAIGY
ncbi:hypothetical protein L9F63_003084, partial [Diploptera punctata]